MMMMICAAPAILLAPRLLPAQQLPGDKGSFTLSPLRTAQLKGATFLYESNQTTLGNVGNVITTVMGQMDDFIKAGQFLPAAAPAFVYRGAGITDRSKPFTLEVGFPVADDTKPVGDFKIGKLESVKCATTIYMGPANQLGRAYERIYAQILAQGLIPDDMRRERYLFFDGDGSKNNIVLIEIALKN